MPRPSISTYVLLSQFVWFLLSTRRTCLALSSTTVPPKSVRIHTKKQVFQHVSVPSCGSNPLQEYMQLPAAQYTCVPMPLNSSLTRIEGSTEDFCLEVPKMCFNIPGVQLIHVLPQVMAKVSVLEDKVAVFSDECTIRGSPIIEKLRLNDRFDFKCVTELTWDSSSNTDNKRKEPSSTTTKVDAPNVICGTAEITVNFYPTGIFARVPRRLQRGVGNIAMYLTLSALLSKFMRSLGRDYEKWSTDLDYRKQRQRMEVDLDQELLSLKTLDRPLHDTDGVARASVRKRALFW